MPGLRATARPTALGVALALALTGSSVAAAPSVMVWPGSPGLPVAPVEDALRSEGVEIVPWATIEPALAERRAERAEREQERRRAVEVALELSMQRYLELEIEGMLAALDEAEPHAVALARPGRCEGLWELEFRRGLGLWARRAEGDEPESGARFELALALDPERRPLGELFGPDVTAAFLRAMEQRSARFARPVALQIEPADALVEIDCHPVDEREPSLRPGLHAVRVSAPGFTPWSGVIDLRERDELELRLLPLDPRGDAVRRLAQSTEHDEVHEGSPSAHAVVIDAARSQGAAAVLVVSRTTRGVRVRPWARDGIGSAVERRELVPALRGAMALLDDEGRLHAPAPVVVTRTDSGGSTRPIPPPRPPVLRTWWFWTIVGSLAVTGTAVGLGVGLGRREPSPGTLVVVAR